MKLMENEYGVKMDFYKRNSDISGDEETNHPLDVEESDIIQIKKKGKGMKIKDNINKADKNEEKNEENKDVEINDIDNNDIDTNNIENENNSNNIDNEDNLCIVKIGEQSSERKINEENGNN